MNSEFLNIINNTVFNRFDRYLQIGDHRYLHPTTVASFTNATKWFLATQATLSLNTLGGEHVIQQNPDTLFDYIHNGLTVVYPNSNIDIIHGFVKADPWFAIQAKDRTNLVGKSGIAHFANKKAILKAWEIGSLYVDKDHQGKHHGRELVKIISEYLSNLNQNIPQIAVVTDDNTASLHVFNRLNWMRVDPKFAMFLLGIDVLNGWPFISTIFINPETISI